MDAEAAPTQNSPTERNQFVETPGTNSLACFPVVLQGRWGAERLSFLLLFLLPGPEQARPQKSSEECSRSLASRDAITSALKSAATLRYSEEHSPERPSPLQLIFGTRQSGHYERGLFTGRSSTISRQCSESPRVSTPLELTRISTCISGVTGKSSF